MPILDALNLLIEKAQKKSKAKKNANRHKQMRLQKKLVSNDGPAPMEGHIANTVEENTTDTLWIDMQVNPVDVSPASCALWLPVGDSAASSQAQQQTLHPVLEKVAKVTAGTNYTERMAELAAKMDEIHDWSGSMSKLEIGGDDKVDQLKEFKDIELGAHHGADPWLACNGRSRAALVQPCGLCRASGVSSPLSATTPTCCTSSSPQPPL